MNIRTGFTVPAFVILKKKRTASCHQGLLLQTFIIMTDYQRQLDLSGSFNTAVVHAGNGQRKLR